MSKAATTKIGDVEITQGIAEFLQNMMALDIDSYIVSEYIANLSEVQDFLTRILLGVETPCVEKTKLCLSTIMAVRDQLGLLLPNNQSTEGGVR